MLETKMWRNQVEVISPKLKEWKTQCDVVVVIEENGVLKARTVSYSSRNSDEIEPNNLVAVLAVGSYREGVRISQLYNRMVAKKIKVQSLNSIVDAINILGSD